MLHFFLLLLLVITPISYAEDLEKGLKIAQEVDKRDFGWKSSSSSMKMILVDRQGRETVRNIKGKTLEVDGDGDKSISLFESPRDVKGTAMLTFSHKLDIDEQWLYLPALRRVKRISSRNKSGPFMGSEFAYEDIASQEFEKYENIYIKDDFFADREVFIIKRIPKYKYSGYTQQMVFIDKERYIPLKIDYYDRKKSLLKTLVLSDYNQYLNKFWRAHTMTMTNHQNAKKTTLIFSNYKFDIALKDSDFQASKLKRLR